MLRRRVMGGELYKEVEYIQSSGTQYISLGKFAFAGIFGFEFKFSPIAGKTIENSMLLEYRTSVQVFGYNLSFDSKSTTITSFGFAIGDKSSPEYSVRAGEIAEISFHSPNVIYNGVSSTATGATHYSQTNCPFWILYSNLSGLVRYTKAKIYYLRLFDDDTKIFDLVPCVLTSDIPDSKCANPSLAHTKGTAGLWDKVEDKFYGNSGTGTFIVGPDK